MARFDTVATRGRPYGIHEGMALHSRLMPAALALLLIAAGGRQASPARPGPVRPMPPGLAGTLVFQSDVAGRPAIYTLALDTGAVALLSGDPRWTETNPAVVARRRPAGVHVEPRALRGPRARGRHRRRRPVGRPRRRQRTPRGSPATRPTRPIRHGSPTAGASSSRPTATAAASLPPRARHRRGDPFDDRTTWDAPSCRRRPRWHACRVCRAVATHGCVLGLPGTRARAASAAATP